MIYLCARVPINNGCRGVCVMVVIKRPGERSLRGFAAMDIKRQREIASKGGQSVPDEKRSFSQNPGLAAAAGRKGGCSVPPEKRSFSQDPALAAAAGRKGGLVSGQHRTALRLEREQEERSQSPDVRALISIGARPKRRRIAVVQAPTALETSAV